MPYEDIDPDEITSDDDEFLPIDDTSQDDPDIPDGQDDEPEIPENLTPDEEAPIPDYSNFYVSSKNYSIPASKNVAKYIHSIQIIDDEEALYNTVRDENTNLAYNGINSWAHWKLIPSSRPIINPPEFRSNYIEIPGADGLYDASTLLTNGYPIYGRRKGQIEFYVTRDYEEYLNWSNAYSNAMSFLHGKLVKCVLLDDPYFYYRGRMTVNQWRSEKDWSKIVFDYDFEPYKYAITSTTEPWIWDPFNFVNGVITDYNKYTNVLIDGALLDGAGDEGRYADFNITAGSMRSTPTFTVHTENRTNLRISFYKVASPNNINIGYRDFSFEGGVDKKFNCYDITFRDGRYVVRVEATNSGTCRVTVDYRYGSL